MLLSEGEESALGLRGEDILLQLWLAAVNSCCLGHASTPEA